VSEERKPKVGIIAHIDHGKTALTAAILRSLAAGKIRSPILIADPTPIAPVRTKRKSDTTKDPQP